MAGVLRRPVWFVGLALMAASFLLQALALAAGNLSTVQPIMVTELLFILAILALYFGQRLGWREWVGAGGTAAGLGAFLALSSSSGGDGHPGKDEWFLLLVASGGAIVLSTSLAQKGPRAWRAAWFGVGAAVCFALTAACLKSVAEIWPSGVGHVFSHLETYGVAASGLAGLLLTQHALHAGPVAASQAALLTVNPLSSIVMGIWLFGDHLQRSHGRWVAEAIALGLMSLSLFLLSTSPTIVQSELPERLSSSLTPITPHPTGGEP